jgi:hypothetical protein
MKSFLLAAVMCTGLVSIGGCSSKFLKAEREAELQKNEEFDKAVKIVVEETPEDPSVDPGPEPARASGSPGGGIGAGVGAGRGAIVAKKKPAPKSVKKPAKGKNSKPEAPLIHEPADVEDGQGFVGRRPVIDPFRVGEAVVHDVSYFNISAGQLTLKVDPFVHVNGRKAYNFVTHIETYPRFSSLVHAVDDKAVTFVDFDLLIPRVFTLHVKESNQLKEARSFFDFDKLSASYWEKKITEKSGVEEKKLQWEILPYSQNVFSSIFYMRLFPWEDGKEYAFRVSDDTENLIFKGKTVRREVLETELGPMKAIVVKPEIILKGKFKPVGDIYIWLSDDDRRLVLRIESKIKIGTLVSEIVRLEKGRGP